MFFVIIVKELMKRNICYSETSKNIALSVDQLVFEFSTTRSDERLYHIKAILDEIVVFLQTWTKYTLKRQTDQNIARKITQLCTKQLLQFQN